MTWVGLERYGYLEDAQRLAYRWIYMYVTESSMHAYTSDLWESEQDDDRVR